MDKPIEFKGVGKRYGDFAISGLNLELGRGEVLGFIGPNGAGKTTSIRMLMSLAKPDGGEVLLFGQNPHSGGREARERVGFVYDEIGLNDELSAKELGFLLGGFYRAWDKAAFYGCLERFELKPEQRLSQYSKGMRTRLSLAIALSHRAELLVMDEPTSGLDPVFRSKFLDELSLFMKSGGHSVFFSTHITEDLERIADRVAFINDGRLMFCKTMEEIRSGYCMVSGPLDVLAGRLPQALLGVKRSETTFNALSDRCQEELQALDPRVSCERASLDDIMVYTTREDYRV